jgi:hypothetical protein
MEGVPFVLLEAWELESLLITLRATVVRTSAGRRRDKLRLSADSATQLRRRLQSGWWRV